MSAVLLLVNAAAVGFLSWRCVVVGCEGRRRRQPAPFEPRSAVTRIERSEVGRS